jgi:nitrous oxide reductase accessory protein NosL
MNSFAKWSLAVLVLVLSVPGLARAAAPDVGQAPSCRQCGMDRDKYAHSRVLVEFDDGTSIGSCSIRCAAVELANAIDKSPKAIRVGDYATKELIDAEKAAWVLGGKAKGVMTARGKWAFASKEAAEAFVKENGGEIVTWDEALKAAYQEMESDTKAIRERRKMKKMQGAK